MGPHGELAKLEEKLGHRYHDRGMLIQALTHSSATAEEPTLPSNERLEFLGDSVLQMVVTDYLYVNYPQIPEGQLTRMPGSLPKKMDSYFCAVIMKESING